MKKLLALAVLVMACSQDEPIYPVGNWTFESVDFSGSFTVNSSGLGTGEFTIGGHKYSAVNVNIREGSSITLYSEDNAFVGLYQVTYTGNQFISKYQEYRDCCLPSPITNSIREEDCLLRGS